MSNQAERLIVPDQYFVHEVRHIEDIIKEDKKEDKKVEVDIYEKGMHDDLKVSKDQNKDLRKRRSEPRYWEAFVSKEERCGETWKRERGEVGNGKNLQRRDSSGRSIYIGKRREKEREGSTRGVGRRRKGGENKKGERREMRD